MSSFVCTKGICTFTRVNTDSYAAIPPPSYYTKLPKYYAGNITRAQLLAGLDDPTTAPWTDPKNQDRIGKSQVALTRDFDGYLLNAFLEYSAYGPTGTEWAVLPENKSFQQARCELVYGAFEDTFYVYDPEELIGQKGIIHLIEEDEYYNINFSSWSFQEGGFKYTRDKNPILLPANALPCVKCDKAVATTPVLLGPVNGTFVSIGITGYTPASATVTIKAVSQEHELTSEPNAKGLGQSTVMLRRTRVPGRIDAVIYNVYCTAANAISNCSSFVPVCIPSPGFTNCDFPFVYGVDAAATAL